MLVIYQESV